MPIDVPNAIACGGSFDMSMRRSSVRGLTHHLGLLSLIIGKLFAESVSPSGNSTGAAWT
jgi:hypothetical protein